MQHYSRTIPRPPVHKPHHTNSVLNPNTSNKNNSNNLQKNIWLQCHLLMPDLRRLPWSYLQSWPIPGVNELEFGSETPKAHYITSTTTTTAEIIPVSVKQRHTCVAYAQTDRSSLSSVPVRDVSTVSLLPFPAVSATTCSARCGGTAHFWLTIFVGTSGLSPHSV